MKLVQTVWNVLKGVKDALVLIFMLLFFGGLYAAMSFDPNPARGKGGPLAERDLASLPATGATKARIVEP